MASARKYRGARAAGWPARTASVALVVGIGVIAPGSALPAWAQQSNGGYVGPPPVSSSVPSDPDKPDKNYTQTKGCVTRDKLSPNVEIKKKPWGQLYLQVDEIQKIVRAATGGTAGAGIRVGVIDTGVSDHPFFGGRVEGGGDYVADNKGLQDCDGHGTEVAGIIAANPPPDIGFRGMAPDATIVSIRQSSQNYAVKSDSQTSTSSTSPPPSSGNGGGGSGGNPTGPNQAGNGRQQAQDGTAGNLTTLAQAVVHAVTKGVKVINMSVDNCRPVEAGMSDGEASLQAAVKYATDKDVVVVAAAGNVTDTCKQNDQLDPNAPRNVVTPPWFSDDVLSVAAIDATGGVAQFSVNGPWVSVAAPGTEITSLDPAAGSSQLANLTIDGVNAQPSPIQGTSFAAPYVAGLAVLVRAMHPELSARQVMHRIMSTAQHPAAPGGRDNFVGYGVVNPIAALTASVASEQGGGQRGQNVRLPADLPPPVTKNWTPMVVALAGAGGGLIALLITLFVVHTIRRTRPEGSGGRKVA